MRVKPRNWSRGQAGSDEGGCGGCLAVEMGRMTTLEAVAPILLPLGVFPETLGLMAGATAVCEP